MGLDIYVHKTRNQFDYEINKDNFRSIIDSEEIRMKGLLMRDYAKCIQRLTEARDGRADAAAYEKVNRECLELLATHFSYPEFDINVLGYHRDWNNETRSYDVTYTVEPLDVWIEKSGKIMEQSYAPHIAYFRKVNLLFAYFQDKFKLIDEYFAPITKDDCLDIIDRCKKVLADHSQADKLLPTRSGFFFGSTGYDEYYYQDVEDVLKQFTEKVLPVYDEPAWEKGSVPKEYENEKMNCYILFSW